MKLKNVKINKGLIKSSLSGAVMLLVAMVSSEGAHADENIEIAPPNVVNVQIVDEEGNEVNGVDVTLTSSSGKTAASWVSGSSTISDNTVYGIQGEISNFNIPLNKLFTLEAGQEFDRVIYDGKRYYYPTTTLGMDIGTSKTMRVYYEDDTVETDYVVGANSYAIIVDECFTDSTYNDYIYVEYDTKIVLKENAGKVVKGKYEPGEYYLRPYTSVNGTIFCDKITVSDTETEFVKKKVYLPDLYSDMDDSYYYEVNGVKLYLLEETDNCRNIIIAVSGPLATITQADENGCIEVYADKNTMDAHIDITYNYMLNGTLSKFSTGTNCFSTNFKEVNVNVLDYPDTGTNISEVPSGTYTLSLSNLPSDYKNPGDVSVTVTDCYSIKYVKVKLEGTHITHKADTSKTYYNITSHWNLCTGCEKKMNEASHTMKWVVDKEATGTETGYKHQKCTGCDYTTEKVAFYSAAVPETTKETIIETTKETSKETTTERATEVETTKEVLTTQNSTTVSSAEETTNVEETQQLTGEKETTVNMSVVEETIGQNYISPSVEEVTVSKDEKMALSGDDEVENSTQPTEDAASEGALSEENDNSEGGSNLVIVIVAIAAAGIAGGAAFYVTRIIKNKNKK